MPGHEFRRLGIWRSRFSFGAQPARNRVDNADKPSRRPVYRIFAAVLLGTVVVAIAWIVVTGLIARAYLTRAQQDIDTLRQQITAGNLDAASDTSLSLARNAHRAHELTTGPAWWVSSNLPFVGTPMRTGRTITEQTDRVTTSVPELVSLVRLVTTSSSSSRGIDVNLLSQASVSLSTTADSMLVAQQDVQSAPGSWLPVVSNARHQLIRALDSVIPQVRDSSRAAKTLAPMLGSVRPQRYFIGFMNEAESRGLGGLPGAFAILTVDKGKFTFTHFGNDTELVGVRTGLQLGADYSAQYGQDDPVDVYMNSDVSPDFRDAARIWAAMWQRKSGQQVSGALMIDPTALSRILRVTGPAHLPDGTAVSAANVVALTERDQYSKYQLDSQRNAYLRTISRAVSTKLISGAGNPVPLAQALIAAVHQRRIAVWSSQPDLESAISRAGFGAVLEPHGAFSGFTVINTAGSKLDYYLDRRMVYLRKSCAADATATATLSLHNDAPRSGLPRYVTTRLDRPDHNYNAGDNSLLVTYYGSPGATIDSVTVNGISQRIATFADNGLTVATFEVELPVQGTRFVRVTLREPASNSAPEILRQPLVRPLHVSVTDSCGS